MILARVLQPEGRGEYAAVLLWPSAFAAFGAMGLSTALARAAAQEKDPIEVTRAGLLMSLITGTVTTILCLLALPLLLKGQGSGLLTSARAAVPLIMLSHIALAFVAVDQGCGRFRSYNWTRVILNPIYLLILVGLLAFREKRVISFAVALVVANAVVCSVRVFFGFHGNTLIGRTANLGPLAKDALRYGLADLFIPIFSQMDKAILLYTLGTRDLGFYSVAMTAAAALSGVSTAIGTVTFSLSARDGVREIRDKIARVARTAVLLWSCFGLVVSICMPFLLPFVYGAAYKEAVSPAICLIPAVAIGAIGGILEQSLRARGKAFVGLEGRALGFLFLVTGCYFLVPVIGLHGAVVSLFVCNTLYASFVTFRFHQHFQTPFRSILIPTNEDMVKLADLAFRRNPLVRH